MRAKIYPLEPVEKNQIWRSRIGFSFEIIENIGKVDHAYSHFKITLHIYICKQLSGTPSPKAHSELKWVSPKHFEQYAFPKANHKFLSKLS